MSCENNIEQLNFIRGVTFLATVRWEGREVVYKPISGITQAAPVEISCTNHDVPAGWRVAVSAVKGMNQINALNIPPKDKDFHRATVVSANAIALNDVNAANFSTYKSGGYIEYKAPVDLDGFTARMQIRSSINSVEIIDELTTEDLRLPSTGIVIDNSSKTITVKIASSVTENYAFYNAVYSLELVSSDGIVSRVIYGDVVCSNDVTR